MTNITQEKLEKRNHELSILNTIAQALNAEIDLQKALETTLEQIVHLFDLQTGWIWLMNPETDEPYLASALNLPPALVNNPQLMEGSAYCHCLDTYESGDFEDATNISTVVCTRLKNLTDGTDGLRHHASLPLYTQHGDKLGMLNVVSSDWDELSTEDLRLLTTVGDMISIALERASLFTQSTRIGIVEERNRLAREIHDTLAQGLTAIALQLETADTLLELNDERGKIRELVQKALALTRMNLEEARRSVMDLRSASLEGRTLGEAIELYAQALTQQHELKLTLLIGDSPRLPVRVEIGLYRVVQEALTNVIKHAQAQSVTVELRIIPNRIELMIEDDGRGFDPDDCPEGHFGIISMNERVHLLGGAFEISSTINDGTRLDVIVPMENLHG